MPLSDPSADEFHKWVGYSITAWANVEQWLFELCWRSLKTSQERAAIVYFKTPTLDGRIGLTDELVRSVLPRPERKDGGHHHPDLITWDKLRKKINSHLGTRRKIAHHPVRPKQTVIEISGAVGAAPVGAVPVGGGSIKYTASWLEIYISENEQLRGKDGDSKPLKANDIEAHSYIIKALADEVMNFYLSVFLQHIGRAD